MTATALLTRPTNAALLPSSRQHHQQPQASERAGIQRQMPTKAALVAQSRSGETDFQAPSHNFRNLSNARWPQSQIGFGRPTTTAALVATIKAQVGFEQSDIRDTKVKLLKKSPSRFNGVREIELLTRTIPDHLAQDLDILIVGINPGLYSAYKGHHYAGPGNHFWKCLFLSGLIPKPLTPEDDYLLIKYGIGFTNIVQRTTRSSADLNPQEVKDGAILLYEKIRQYQPKIAVFNGKEIYRIFSGRKNFPMGHQPNFIEGTSTIAFVMPSSSARCSQLPRAMDKLPFYVALRKLRDHLNAKAVESRPFIDDDNDDDFPEHKNLPNLPASPPKLVQASSVVQEDQSKEVWKNCRHSDDDNIENEEHPPTVDPKLILESTSFRAFLDLDIATKDDSIVCDEDPTSDAVAKASSLKQTEELCLLDDQIPSHHFNLVPRYRLPENGETGTISDTGGKGPAASGQNASPPGGADPAGQQQTFGEGYADGSAAAQQQQQGYLSGYELTVAAGGTPPTGVMKPFSGGDGSRSGAGSNGSSGSGNGGSGNNGNGGAAIAFQQSPLFHHENMQTGFVQFGDGNGQSPACNGDIHQGVASDSQAMRADPQTSQQSQSSESNGPVVAIKSEPASAAVTTTTAYQLTSSSMNNDELNKLYASILNATTSTNNGSASPAIDTATLNLFQMPQEYRAADTPNHMPSNNALMQQQQALMQNQYASQQQMAQIQQQQLQHFIGNGSESHGHPAASASVVATTEGGVPQGLMPTLIKNEPVIGVGPRPGIQVAQQQPPTAEKPPSRRFALTPDMVLHVEEAIEAVIQRAREGPLDMPVNKHAEARAKHAATRPAVVAFRTPAEKVQAAAAAAASHSQHHHQGQQQQQQQQQQQHHHQQQQHVQQQQQPQQQQHAAHQQQSQHHVQQQQQSQQQQQQMLNLQMQAVANVAAAQFDLGRSIKGSQDNTAAVAAALLGAQGAYDQNCQSGASLYSQYFQQQQQQSQQQQQGGGASNQFSTPFIAATGNAGVAASGGYATTPQWPTSAFSTTVSQATNATAPAPVYAAHPINAAAATYFQTPLYHQNAAAALAPYFQMNVNPTAAQQQAMYGQYAAATGGGFNLQQQQQPQQSPHNL